MHSTWVSQGSSRAGWGLREGAGDPTAASQGREGGAGPGGCRRLVCIISANWRDVGLALVVWLLAQGDRGRGVVARSVGVWVFMARDAPPGPARPGHQSTATGTRKRGDRRPCGVGTGSRTAVLGPRPPRVPDRAWPESYFPVVLCVHPHPCCHTRH